MSEPRKNRMIRKNLWEGFEGCNTLEFLAAWVATLLADGWVNLDIYVPYGEDGAREFEVSRVATDEEEAALVAKEAAQRAESAANEIRRLEMRLKVLKGKP